MFTKSIQPGDWVKCDCPEVSGWFDVLAQLTATSYSCVKINSRGQSIEYGYLIEYKDITQRIGDRPLLEEHVIEYIPGHGYCECRRVHA